MKKLFGLALLGASTLLLMSTSVLAATYSPSFSNCNVTNIGPGQWRATFRLNIFYANNGASSTANNTFYAWLPGLDTRTGRPLTAYIQRVTSPGWNNMTGPASVRISSATERLLFFGTGSNDNIITSGGTFSINFTTAGNNAYPALFMRYTHISENGGGQETPLLVLPGGICHGGATPPATLPPITELEPPEPEFSLKSAVWELNAADVGDLPEVTAPGNGYAASIKNIGSNNLCVSYVSAGVRNKEYALGVTNGTNLQGGRNLFMMNGAAGSQLPYNLQLVSNDSVTGNNFSFPAATAKYITLSQAPSGVNGRSEMCWTPAVSLFKTASTQSGLHTDTVNFVITPKA
ncbi:hypothetical protein Z042_13930 [Chania multitudinisentens RB-25]|uniref:Uncharacterized protein n=1 Tax=Chania multitudinisentens RB-25 TaxID=1441930 RepID=W0LKE3_9GAMM|nr:hypothetical protein [Chania multitudinisentens]AHG22802.1 hypothetical protein Z042_13930 [Chania multitudinisentens RB-25]